MIICRRPEWVNYLIGKSRPQYSDKYRNGLDIPVDMALALHTDAGTAPGRYNYWYFGYL